MAKQRYDEDELLARAILSHKARTTRDGTIYDQPSTTASGIANGHVELRNVRGLIIRYRILGTPEKPRLKHAG